MKSAIVMQTDFTKGVATCTMDGVIASIDPEVRTYDCCHTIAPFDIYGASCSLDFVVDFWPAGTIFVSVVDPGVGTSRRACCARLANGCYIITPDNGTLTHVKKRVGILEVRQIDETKNRLETTREVSIFHGRDLFAYCAGKFAAGLIDFEGVGPAYPVDEIVMLDLLEPYEKDGIVRGMITTSERGFGLVRAVGMILLGFGIVQIGLSLKSHDPSQRANGIMTVAGGVVITFAKEIMNLIVGSGG